MSVTRINEFEAKEGKAEDLHAFLHSVAPLIARSHGCESCRVLRGRENPGKLIVLEVWTTVEAHLASVKAIPPERLTAVMALLASPPKGAYFTE